MAKKGGEIKVDENGTWIYTNKDDIKVAYRNGYPDFKGAGLVEQEVDINSFDNYYTDFKKQINLRNEKKRIENTWHHHEDGKTMQEVKKKFIENSLIEVVRH